MKKIFFYTLECFTLLFIVTCFKPCLATNYYFSSSSGDDSRTKSSAGLPWKSIEKLNSIFNQLKPGDSVLFKRGDTFYGSILINASGAADEPIVIADYGNGTRPVITSFKIISDWKPTDKKNIYVSHIKISNRLQVVVLDKQPKAMGRYPNTGYLYFESHNDSTSITDSELPSTPDWTGGELVLRRQRWVLDRFPIVSVVNKTITYQNAKAQARDGYGYFIQNHLLTLDTEGEWFYDSTSEDLYIFFKNEPIPKDIQIATLDNMINCKGFNNINFRNIIVKGCNGNGFDINRSNAIKIFNCDIEYAGRDGIKGLLCKNLSVASSSITDCYNDGINALGSLSSSIKNNVIRNTYLIAGMGGSGNVKGAGIRDGDGGIIENNTITNSGYIGIQLGKGAEIVKNNVVDSFCIVKDDGGGIYAGRGNQNISFSGKIIGNVVSNGIGAGDGTPKTPLSSAEGIYMDAGASGIEISDNTITNCHWGIYLHNAYDIRITNNTLNNNAVQLYAKHDQNHPINQIDFSNNILIAEKDDDMLMGLRTIGEDIKAIGIFANNLYLPADKKNKIFIQYKQNDVNFNERLSLPEVVQKFGFEKGSDRNFSNDELLKNADYKIFTNTNGTPKTFLLDNNYLDKNQRRYQKSVEVAPYTSVVLFKK